MPTITPFLWFDTQAEEAMNFYVSIFSRSRVVKVDRAQGKVMSVEFELEGQRFLGLNAGPHHRFNEAVSFFVACETQAEIDALWARLLDGGGRPDQCGWLKDRFGLSWQVIPTALRGLLTDPDPAGAQRAMGAMLQMQKLDLAKLLAARDGKST
jgi:predicted 3-demethylubiquinone-9 3-methyltransferase (glyoxalase superfamily)